MFSKRAMGACALMVVCGVAQAGIATFDSGFTEGLQDFDVIDDGVRLHDLHLNLPGSPDPNKFCIEDASSGSLGAPFTGPNALAFVGYVPGPDTAFGRIHSFRAAATAGKSTFGQLDIWTLDFWGNCSISLRAIDGGSIVDSQTVNVVTNAIHHYRLSVEFDDFEYMELVVTGGQNDNCTFAVVDNVRLDAVPEPSSLAVIGLGLTPLLFRKRK